MENLNKTQIVLLTLLTSFVTSIATGIVTVTLMDQAPAGVTQTINRVIERTIETVTPGKNQVTTVVKEVIVKEEDLIVNAVEKSSKSLVKINAVDSEGVIVPLGIGVAMSGDGYVVTDKSRIEGNRNNLFVVYGGNSFPADVVSDEDSKVAILKLRAQESAKDTAENTDKAQNQNNEIPKNKIPELTPASLADSDKIQLGQSVISLVGDGGTVLTGIVSKLDKSIVSVASTTDTTNVDNKVKEEIQKQKLKYIETNINIDKKSTGGPIFDTSGNVVGINILYANNNVVAVPINNIKETIFKVANVVKEEAKGEDLTKSK
jgi:S1-C subfamily serine protease